MQSTSTLTNAIRRMPAVMGTLALSAVLAFSAFPIASAPAPAYADDLDDAAAALEEAKAVCEEAEARQAEVDAQVAEIEASIAEIEAVLPQQQEQASQMMREIYRAGGEEAMELSLIDIIFSSTDVSSLLKNIDYVQKIADMRYEALNASVESKHQLAAQQEELAVAKAEADAAVEEADAAKADAQEKYNKAKRAAAAVATSANVDWSSASGGYLTLAQMKFQGVVYYAGYRYTYYSQSVLPGGGLKIPGRHVENGCVVDGDGYICVASSTHPKGTIVPTPLAQYPQGKVYDSGCARGTIDLYIA